MVRTATMSSDLWTRDLTTNGAIDSSETREGGRVGGGEGAGLAREGGNLAFVPRVLTSPSTHSYVNIT